MNRSGVAAIVICAAVAGLGGGYLLGLQAQVPATDVTGTDVTGTDFTGTDATQLPAPAPQSVPRDPGTPNRIAELATAKSGGPVTPFSGRASPIQSSLASFAIAYPSSEVQACLNSTLAGAVSSIGTPAVAGVTPCGSGGTAKLEGRFRLASRPTVALVGKPSPGAVGCDATLRWGIEPGTAAQELRASAHGDTAAAACDVSGKAVVSKLLAALAKR